MITKSHYYFNLNYSPWPIISRLNSFNLFLSILNFIKFSSYFAFLFNVMIISLSRILWWIFYRGEFSLEGKNSRVLEKGIKLSILLFISSELFFFFSFFWSYFHFFLSPTIETGLIWPPENIVPFDCLNVPLINTLILIRSGVRITMRHHYLIRGKKINSFVILLATLILGLIFTILQALEYNRSFFSIGDSTFGTTFFMLTGFHGIHVIVGTIFLTRVLFRQYKFSSSKENSLRFELSSWYWHFVDVVWIFLYFTLYYLNS